MELEGSVSIKDLGEDKYMITIVGEDHSLGNLLTKILLSMSEVKFSYYEHPHPLDDKIVLYVHLEKGKDIKKVLLKAAEQALQINEEFKELFLKALEKKGRRLEA